MAEKAAWPGALWRLAAWLGPLALALYYVWQLTPTIFGGIQGHIEWFWLTIAGLVGLVLVRRRPSLRAVDVMAVEVLAASLVTDAENSTANGLRDLHLYLHAGGQFVVGGTVYTPEPIAHYPSDLGFLPFLYPPPTLPVFGLLSQLPPVVVESAWLLASLAIVIGSLRLFGLPWRWALIVLAWPPIEQGLFVGNVAVPALLLLAVAPRLGAALALGPLFKPQSAITAVWLLRERAWRQVVLGGALVLAVVLVTLPLTGLGVWGDWFNGLLVYQESQRLLPGLFGIGLGRYLPGWLYAVVAVGVILGALWARGKEGLARLSLASIVASPSLWSHGFLAAIPAFLRLRSGWFWLAAGLVCAGPFPGPQLALAIAVAGWLVAALSRSATRPDSGLHPLGRAIDPWPDVPPDVPPLDSPAVDEHAALPRSA